MTWVSLLAGDIPAERLARNMNAYLKMYCQGIKFGCPNAALLGICAGDLVHPSIILPDSTKYTYVYFISCQGEVTKKGTRQQALNQYGYTCTPDLSCAKLHAKIEKSEGHAVQYGRMQAAYAQQWAKLHPQSGGLFNASAAVTAAIMRPHAPGLLAGPSLHTVRAAHVSTAAKQQVFGLGEPPETVLNTLHRLQWDAMMQRQQAQKMRPGVCLYDSLPCASDCYWLSYPLLVDFDRLCRMKH